jgi:hypothetical protein
LSRNEEIVRREEQGRKKNAKGKNAATDFNIIPIEASPFYFLT